MMKSRCNILAVNLAVFAISTLVAGQGQLASAKESSEANEAKVEFGLGLGGQSSNDYRGSKASHIAGVPFPYLIYRGERFRIDRNGARGRLLEGDNYEFSLSADAALSGNDDENNLRRGMPELDSAFEFGPSLKINITGETLDDGVTLRLPARAVFTVSTSQVRHIGFTFDPKLTWRKYFKNDWRLSAHGGLLFGSNRYHDYYYKVSPEFVASDRAQYDAEAGYSGVVLKGSVVKRSGPWWFGVSLRHDILNGAAFEDSPLVETKRYSSITFALVRMLWVKR